MGAYQISENDDTPSEQCPTCGSIRRGSSKESPLSLAIRSIRRRMGLTQTEFSQQLGWRQGAHSQYESGATEPCSERLLAILRLSLTDSERSPLLAALAHRGIVASDLAASLLNRSSTETSIGAPVGGVNV